LKDREEEDPTSKNEVETIDLDSPLNKLQKIERKHQDRAQNTATP
jgi:hypothetical protein